MCLTMLIYLYDLLYGFSHYSYLNMVHTKVVCLVMFLSICVAYVNTFIRSYTVFKIVLVIGKEF
jgi:hypothetical protein